MSATQMGGDAHTAAGVPVTAEVPAVPDVLVGAGGELLTLGLTVFMVGALTLGMTFVGVFPAGATGVLVPVVVFTSGLLLLVTTVWGAAARPVSADRYLRHGRGAVHELRRAGAGAGPRLVRDPGGRGAGGGDLVHRLRLLVHAAAGALGEAAGLLHPHDRDRGGCPSGWARRGCWRRRRRWCRRPAAGSWRCRSAWPGYG